MTYETMTLANPRRFDAFARLAIPIFGALSALFFAAGLGLSFAAPPDYQQGETARIMFVHVPAAWMALAVYGFLAALSAAHLIFRAPVADIAAEAAAPLGASFTALALITGALWGQPIWGTWWVWDARLTSVLVLLFLYLGYMALRRALEKETQGARAAALLALAGAINLPIVKFSVDWWSTLHQPASVFRADGPRLDSAFLTPLLVMAAAYAVFFAALLLILMRAELLRRKNQSLAAALAR